MSYAQPVINMHILKHLFPHIKNKALLNYLRIDNDSVHYISTKDIAEKITKIISYHLSNHYIQDKDVHITDATAGVGGDTISFSRSYKFVDAIEINKLRYDYLNNNLHVYGITNVKTYNDDFVNVIYSLNNHNVIFIDPPWGGIDYKKQNSLRIKLSDNKVDLEDICLEFLFGFNMNKNPEIIALKLPKNYDIYYLYKKLNVCKIYLYDLGKMYIIIIENLNIQKKMIQCPEDTNKNVNISQNDVDYLLNDANDIIINDFVDKYVNKILKDVIIFLSR